MTTELLWRKNESLKVGDILESVSHLTFGYGFNQPLQFHSIPDSVTHLEFSYEFNQPSFGTTYIPESTNVPRINATRL